MKLKIVGILFILMCFSIPISAGTTAVKIGEVECIKRLIDGNDKIQVLRINDPDNPFISIFFTSIKSGVLFAMSDPSNTSIAARLTSPIPVEDGKRQVVTTTVLNLASVSKSIGSKVMKIARFYDKEEDTLVYLVYTTKMLDGSTKHSLSVVPLSIK